MLLNLQAALLAMSIATGYYHDMREGAVKLDVNADIETLIGDIQIRPYVVIDVQPEVRTYSPAKIVELVTPVNIFWFNDPPNPDDATRMQMFFRGCADVERAIAKDITRGGLAIDTLIIDRTLDHTIDSSQVVAVIRTTMKRRRHYGSP